MLQTNTEHPFVQQFDTPCSLRRRPHTDPHISLKNRTRPCRCDFCAQNSHTGSVWGLLRRLQGPYVIPALAVPRHLYIYDKGGRKQYSALWYNNNATLCWFVVKKFVLHLWNSMTSINIILGSPDRPGEVIGIKKWKSEKIQNFQERSQFRTRFRGYVQCDAIRWEQLENWHFSRGYNFWTNDFILILKTPTRPYSCVAIFFLLLITCLNVLFLSCRLLKKVRFLTVPIWLLHTVLFFFFFFLNLFFY